MTDEERRKSVAETSIKLNAVAFKYDTMAKLIAASGLPMTDIAELLVRNCPTLSDPDKIPKDELKILCQLFVKIGVLVERNEMEKQ